MQINSSHHFQVMNYCHGGEVLSSGGSDMGSPFMLQQKTCQAAFQDLSALSVQGEINSYLGRFIFPSLFMLLLLLSSLFFSCLFLPFPLFLPYILSCLSGCLSQTFLQVFSGSVITHLLFLFQEQHSGISVCGLKKPSLLCSAFGHLDSTF